MSITELMYSNTNNQPSMERAYGVTLGVVTDIEDPEKLGRIKVKLLNRDTSLFETGWIRITTPMVGKEWGMFFFPEIGDEVLVAFGDGDITKPYVIGSLWNANYKPPVIIEEKKNIVRKVKTKHGHELIFHDEDGKDSIEIHTPKEFKIFLDDETEHIIITDKDEKNLVKIDSKNGIVSVIGEKKINVHCGNSKVELDSEGNSITMESTQTLNLKSQQINIDAKSALTMKAASNINVKTDGPLNLKGAVVKMN
ncbi:MAG: phage baseplate assembly protein V [Bacillota bacterium]